MFQNFSWKVKMFYCHVRVPEGPNCVRVCVRYVCIINIINMYIHLHKYYIDTSHAYRSSRYTSRRGYNANLTASMISSQENHSKQAQSYQTRIKTYKDLGSYKYIFALVGMCLDTCTYICILHMYIYMYIYIYIHYD